MPLIPAITRLLPMPWFFHSSLTWLATASSFTMTPALTRSGSRGMLAHFCAFLPLVVSTQIAESSIYMLVVSLAITAFLFRHSDHFVILGAAKDLTQTPRY